MKPSNSEKSLFQRLFIIFIILISPLFLLREYQIIKAKMDPKINLAEDFSLMESYQNNDKLFTFIVITHDSEESIKQNFLSLINQDYPSFRIVYIDKGSTDGTVEILQKMIDEKNVHEKVTLLARNKEHEVFESYYNSIHQCDDQDVIIHLYGNDWLASNDVLQCLNKIYAKPDVWLTYGQYVDYASYEKGLYNPTPKKMNYKKKVARAPWINAPLKTFYAGLFKKSGVNKETSEYYFLSIKSELNLLAPVAEISKAHVQFIPTILYIHKQVSEGRKRRSVELRR